MWLRTLVAVFAPATNTVQADMKRTMAAFAGLSLQITWTQFQLDEAQTRRVLGAEGQLKIRGGPTRYRYAPPGGPIVTIEDEKGWFTDEVWNLTRCWPDIADVRIFYVPGFEDGV